MFITFTFMYRDYDSEFETAEYGFNNTYDEYDASEYARYANDMRRNPSSIMKSTWNTCDFYHPIGGLFFFCCLYGRTNHVCIN